MLASSGYVCQVEAELCIGCESCVEFCQFAALSLVDFTAWVDYEACMGCGVCVQHCPEGALVLEREPAKGVPLELCALTGLENAVHEPHLPRSA
jgi:heterodisulfide reductase subunit A-like polyferredoxin